MCDSEIDTAKSADNGDNLLEDAAIKRNCEFITRFVNELTQEEWDSLSLTSREHIAGIMPSLRKLKVWSNITLESTGKKLKIKYEEENEDGADSCNEISDEYDAESEESGDTKPKKTTKSKIKNDDLLAALVDKLDNKKIPALTKYNESSGQSLRDYLKEFEAYCKNNIRGSKQSWISELEQNLEGETLKSYRASKDVNDTYDEIKLKLLTWYDDTKPLRMKKARSQFDNVKHDGRESLRLYSSRLEQIYKRAYPNSNIDKSTKLREKFIHTIPKSARKQLMNSKLSGEVFGNKGSKPMTWDSIKKFARHRDIMMEEIKISSSEEDFQPKEIVINTASMQSKRNCPKNNEVEVSYDCNQKKFFISNPRFVDLKPPDVQFFQNRTPRNNYQDRSYRPNNGSFFNSKSVQRNPSRDGVKQKRFSSPPETARACFRCGKLGHFISQCRASAVTCFTCRNTGHTSRECRYRNQKFSNAPFPTSEPKYREKYSQKRENDNKKSDERNGPSN